MRERLALLMEYLKNRLAFGKNKKTRKGFILTMVALVEVLAISVVSVSAWVETISTITIKAEGAKIDNYVYTNADIGSGDGYSNKIIDLTKYFRAAGGVHLASASSADGENIFFPIKNSGASEFGVGSYRCADVNDKNVNYIDFSFNVKVDETFKADHAEFYLDQVPKITIGGENVSGNLVRMAITDTDTQNTVVCGSNAGDGNVVNKADGTNAPENVQAFSDFVVSSEPRPTELFRVDRGSSKTINIKVWLQDDRAATAYAGKTVSITDVNIVTQNKKGNSTLFVVTSATTGYWDPPATITVTAGKKDAGDPKVSYDGLTSTTISVTPGTKVKLIANPKKGFVLKNWVNSDTSAVADGIDSNGYFTPTASGNYNFTAVYVESLTFEAYVRTYDGANLSESTNGGSVEIKCGNQNSTVDSNDGTHITLNAVKGSTVTYYAKAKDGYVFEGWYTDEACESISESSSDKYELANVEVSKKLYAKFKVDTYTVEAYTQHGNNAPFDKAGKVSFDNNKYASKVTTTVNRNGEVTFYAKPESGYAFIGWYESKDAADPKVAVKDCILDNGVYSTKMTIQYSDVKTYALYARFKALYTVEAKAMYNNGNVVTAGTVQVGNEKADKISKAPVMEGENVTVKASANNGYKFAGWYKDEACNEPYFDENNNVSPITLNKVSKGITLYAKFELETTESTTTIYFEPRDGFSTYNAYVYSDSGTEYKGGWPGKVADYDDITGYYKLEFTTSDKGKFRVIVNNGSGTQYPSNSGLEGTIGKTYLFESGSPEALVEYVPKPKPITSIDITLVDSTDNSAGSKWISNSTPKMRLVLPDGSYRDLSSIKGQTNWTWKDIPANVTSFTIQRINPNTDNEVWNSWNTGNRGTKTIYTATGDGTGNWQ